MSSSITDMLEVNEMPYTLVGDQIRCTCPDSIHVPRKGRPSTREDSFSINANTGLWMCWTCGASGNAWSLVNELGFDPEFYWQLDLDLEPGPGTAIDRTAPVDCEWIKRMGLPPDDYLNERGISRQVAEWYNIRWHPKSESWIFPFGECEYLDDGMTWAMTQFAGYEMKRPNEVRSHGPKGQYLFGQQAFDESILMVVESPLDAAYIATWCDKLPVQPVATFGAQVTQRQLALLSYKHLIVAMDNDIAGWESSERIMQADANGYSRFQFDYGEWTNAKDPGEMTHYHLQEQVRHAIWQIQDLSGEGNYYMT